MKSADLEKWRVTPTSALLWRRWEDEFVIFNPASGQTHLLNLVAGKALRLLDESPKSATEVMHKLSAATGIESSTDFLDHLQRLIAEFDELGLVEPVGHEQ